MKNGMRRHKILKSQYKCLQLISVMKLMTTQI